jgi:diguanylate cyclase (GGDEF)-like protein
VGYAVPIFVVLGETIAWQADARRRLEHELTRQALHDPLTGLANRALLLDRLEAALARAERRGPSVQLVFLDVDDFKSVNDQWGHDEGDRVLVALADAIRHAIRPGDTACRLAGDEFVVVIESDDDQAAFEVTRRIQAGVARREDLCVRPSLSAGIATDRHATSAIALLRCADTALYAAKARGRGRTVAFNNTTAPLTAVP